MASTSTLNNTINLISNTQAGGVTLGNIKSLYEPIVKPN